MKNKSRQSLSLAPSEGPPWRLCTRYYIHPADGLERPRFVLAVLEFAFLIDAHPPEGLIASFPAHSTRGLGWRLSHSPRTSHRYYDGV
ncbi:MAG: hypothetical protein WA231_17585 [Methylocella sp.]